MRLYKADEKFENAVGTEEIYLMFWKETKSGNLKPKNYKPNFFFSDCLIAHNNNWNQSSFRLILCPSAGVE